MPHNKVPKADYFLEHKGNTQMKLNQNFADKVTYGERKAYIGGLRACTHYEVLLLGFREIF